MHEISNNIREARNFAFHPGSTAKLMNSDYSTYEKHLSLCQKALEVMDKMDKGKQTQMMAGAKRENKSFTILKKKREEQFFKKTR